MSLSSTEILNKFNNNKAFFKLPIPLPQNQNFNGTKKIFIGAGQSNMNIPNCLASNMSTYGWGGSNLTVNGCKIYNAVSNQLETLIGGTNSSQKTASGQISPLAVTADEVGFELSMMNYLTAVLGEVGLIKYGSGATQLELSGGVNDWNVASVNELWDNFKNNYVAPGKALFDAEGSAEIAGFYWIQGERDGDNGVSQATYQADLTAIINDIRTFTGITNLPVVIVRLSPYNNFYNAGYNNVMLAQDTVASNLSNVSVLDFSDLEKSDQNHYSERGALIGGVRIAKKFLKLINK